MLSFAIPGTVIGVSLCHRLQRAADRADRHRHHPRAVLHLPQHAGRRARRRRLDVADRPQPRRILADARRQFLADLPPRSCCRCCRPAILAALVYSFVRAMTAISAIIFLVSARYDMSTSYIVGRVENNEYGIAIAYSAVLIAVMLVVIGLMQLAVGSRNIGRRGMDEPTCRSRAPMSACRRRRGSRQSQEAVMMAEIQQQRRLGRVPARHQDLRQQQGRRRSTTSRCPSKPASW